MSSDRHTRQTAIRGLVMSRALSSQAELLAALAQHHGIDARQSTVSRDLGDLGIVLVVDGDDVAYRLPGELATRLDDARNRPLILVASSASRASSLAEKLRERGQAPGSAVA